LRDPLKLRCWNEFKKAFGSEVASVFLTKRRCNPFDKEKKHFTIHGTHSISAFKMQEKKKQTNAASAPFMLIN
jgi:hypothetical protein